MAGLSGPSIGDAIASGDNDLAPGVSPETVGLEWVGLGLVGVITVGVITATSEYVGNQLYTSLAAVLGRVGLLLAKLLALLTVTSIMGVIAIPVLSVMSQLGLGDLSVLHGGVPSSLVWRWLGGTVFWVVSAQIGFALGILMRQSLLPLFILIIISQLTLPLINLIPIARYSPFAAGTHLYDRMMITASVPTAALSPAETGMVIALWVLAPILVSIFVFSRRSVR
ncbi:hypothetical protein [Actinomyces wuliandei]|uniref:hypothetical protein n=1 Tax=Actinomyces wuliandei TaxID=2057743 RepID=UPI000FDBF000|nr:hypothetical protein [Actinomyces wuliandei]